MLRHLFAIPALAIAGMAFGAVTVTGTKSSDQQPFLTAWDTLNVSHTVTADTDLLVVTVMISATNDITTPPVWDPPGVNEALTLIDETASSGTGSDVLVQTWGLVNPTAKTANLFFDGAVNINYSVISAINYTGTVTTSVAAATNFLAEDVENTNNFDTLTLPSGGTAGNYLYVGAGFIQPDPVDTSAGWVEEQEIVSPTNDSGTLVVAGNSAPPSGVTMTSPQLDEFAGHMLEIVAETAGGGGGETVLVQDTFTDADGTDLDAHTPDVDVVGTGWVLADFTDEIVPADAVEITGNQWVDSQERGAVIDVGESDVTLTFDWTLGAGVNRIVPILRYSDPSNRMQVQMFEDTDNVELIARVAGSNTSVASAPFDFVDNTTYTVEIVMSGDSYDISINGTPVLSTTSTANQTETRFGIFVGSSSVNQFLDNLTITTEAATSIVEDTFTDANGTEIENHTPDVDTVGNGWIDQHWVTGAALAANEAEIQSNQLHIVDTGGRGVFIDRGNTDDYTVEFDWLTGPGDYSLTVVMRYVVPHTGNKNAVYFAITETSGELELQHVIDGSHFQVAVTPLVLNENTTYRIKATMVGDDFEFFVDGVSKLSGTTTEHATETHSGIIVPGAATETQVFDNYIITSSGGVVNNAPAWVITPAPTFQEGVADTYSLLTDCTDADSDPLTFTLNAGSAALPAGVTLVGSDISHDGTSLDGTTNGIIVDCSDGTDTVASPAFPVVINATGAAPSFTVLPSVQSATDTDYTLSYTPSESATFFAVACNPGETAPTAAQVKAGDCGTGATAEASVSEEVVGADTTVLSGVVFPRHDIYSVLNNVDGDSAVAALADQDRDAELGQELIDLTSISPTSPFADTVYFDPDAAAADIVEADSVTSPGGFAITWDADGDFSYTDATGSRQSIDYCIQDTSDASGGFVNPSCWGGADDTIWINNANPACTGEVTLVFTEDLPIPSIDLDDFCQDADDQLTYSVTGGVLPAGLSLGGGGNSVLSGTPTVEDETGVVVTFTATDIVGETDTLLRTIYVVNTVTLPILTDGNVDAAVFDMASAFPWRTGDLGLIAVFICHELETVDEVQDQDPDAATEVTAFAPVTIRVAKGVTCSAPRRRRF